MVHVIKDEESNIIKVDTEDAKVCSKFGASLLYQWENYYFHPRAYEVLSKLDMLKYREDDVILTMFPKSGSTWLSECIYLVVTQYDYAEASKESIELRFPQIDSPSHDVFELISSQYDNVQSTRMIKSSIPPNLLIRTNNKGEGAGPLECSSKPNESPNDSSIPRVISVFRDPRDILVSFYHHCKTVKHYDLGLTFDEFFNTFVSGRLPCGPVWQLFNDSYEYYKEHIDTTLLVFYEDMKRDIRKEICRLCSFLKKPEPRDEAEWSKLIDHLSVEKMRNNATINRQDWAELGLKNENGFEFVRKGQVNDWKNFFSQKQVEIFNCEIIDKLTPELKKRYSSTILNEKQEQNHN